MGLDEKYYCKSVSEDRKGGRGKKNSCKCISKEDREQNGHVTNQLKR